MNTKRVQVNWTGHFELTLNFQPEIYWTIYSVLFDQMGFHLITVIPSLNNGKVINVVTQIDFIMSVLKLKVF